MVSLELGVSLIRSDPKVQNVEVNTRSCRVELAGEDADVERLLRQLAASEVGLL
jgi:ABC-2 type transport system ATP-binding protein